MDALEFLRERKRMCKSFGDYCDGCPLNGKPCTISAGLDDGDCKRIIAIVEQWSKEHPRKTRQSVFLEQWPNAKTDNGVLFCPKNVDTKFRCCVTVKMCNDCRREFWMQEVE